MRTNIYHTRNMPFGAGKIGMGMARAESLINDGRLSGAFVISRDEIENGSVASLMEGLGQSTPSERLRIMAGSTLFGIDGYEDSGEEIYEVPEIRQYFQGTCETWSPWLFAGSILTADLLAIVLACLPNLSCWRTEGQFHVKWSETDMRAFLQRSLPTAAWLHNRAGIGNEEGCANLKAVAAYIGLPFSE